MADDLNSPTPGTKQTAGKAVASGLAVLAASFLAQIGIGDAPTDAETADALMSLWAYAQEAVVSCVLGGVAAASAYFKSNKPKE